MAIQTKTVLKSYFETAKQPTEQNFVDVFDSVLTTSGDQSITGSLTISGSGANLNVLGHITSSGNISASGTIFANNFQSTGGDVAGIDFTDNVNITGHITSSGNISASGTITADKIVGVGIENTFGQVSTSTITPGNSGLNIIGKITASGNISASGTIKGGGLNINGTTTFNDGNITNVGRIDLDEIQDEGQNGTFIKMNQSFIRFDVDEQVSVFSIGLNGNITASGNISASGTISGSIIDGEISSNLINLGGNRLRTANDNLHIMDGGLELIGDVTSSGNISASATSLITAQDLTLDRQLTAPIITNVNTTHVTASGNISASGNIINTGNVTTTHITASGNISASGNLYSADLYLDNVLALQRAGGILNIGETTEQTQIDARHEGLNIVGSIGISGVSHITSSGNISSSGTITSQRVFTNLFSSSGKISAFGSSSLHGLPTSQPTITGSLWISGSGYGAGAQSGYLMIFQG